MTNDTSPCPGCGVRQYGKRVPSMLSKPPNTPIYICQACEQYENTQIFRTGKPLQGVGKNHVSVDRC